MTNRTFIKRIISNPLVQTFLIYVSGGWIVLELTDYIVNKYELNERISDLLPVILLICLPLVVFLGWYVGRDREEIRGKAHGANADRKSSGIVGTIRSRPWISIPVMVIVMLLLVTGIRSVHRLSKKKWALTQALPQIKDLFNDMDYVGAFTLGQEARRFIPDNPEYLELEPQITRNFSVFTEPDGVEVYCMLYSHPEEEWAYMGTTPLVDLKMPNRTLYRWRLEKEGYETVFAAAPTHMDTLFRTLHETGQIPEGMVYVDGITLPDGSVPFSQKLNGYFIDKFEVSNQMYKAFMDQGGYENPVFWQEDFITGDDTLHFDEAIQHFTDITGRPGPAFWEAGDYPDGQDDYPVNGISWYEAAAYASYAGKNLPTIIHWQSAAGFFFDREVQLYSTDVVPLSNMNGSGIEPVGNRMGMNYYGTYDMAGNVREWCWNETPEGRTILGGAWNEASYQSMMMGQSPAFNRSPQNGFRCVLLGEVDSLPEQIFQPVSFWENNQDYRYIEPASESEFQMYINQFEYDRTDLNSQIVERDESHDDWILEKISFDAAYENERMIAYLFLPKNASPPFQTVIFFPGAYASSSTSIFTGNVIERHLDYLMKNGRAVLFPIYKTTYERQSESYHCSGSSMTHQYTECMVKVVKDFRRSVDYLETRNDIDMERLCYLGDSWGARMGAIIPSVEDRLKICVFVRGGLSKIEKYPEATEGNYVSRVTIPVLMLNGRYDYTFPYESTVLPMFDLLGTPEQDKKLITYETEHFIAKSETAKETLAWLERYFGPVKK